MNTYQISYFPEGFTTAQVLTVQASEFVFTDLFVLFMDTSKVTILAVPMRLDPVILRTATA